MKLKKMFLPVLNPYVGPILVITILLILLVFFFIPKLSYQNKIQHMSDRAVETLNYLKKIRIYYTSNVSNKVRYNTTMKLNYNHRESHLTIPQEETLIHDLSLILPEDNMKIKMYSNYPFPNRKYRVLDSFEKDSLAYFVNNPEKVYKKDVTIDGVRTYRVVVPDIMEDLTCVECHNNRKDSLKRDWEVGDVAGAIEITIPYKNEIILNSEQIRVIVYVFIFLILLLIIHYVIISMLESKTYEKIRKELEDEVRDRTNSLKQTNKLLNQYKRAVDFSAIVSKTDKEGVITYVNDEFIKISKYSEKELLGNSHNIIRHEDMPKAVFEDLWKTIKSKKIWKGTVKNKAKDGTAYYVASTIIPILNYKDEIEEYLAIRLDITDLVESEQRAQKADMAKSIFLANMSHEIRTPLNAIIGFSEVLSNSKKIDEMSKKQSTIINKSANTLLEIINDILDVSKIESGNFEVVLEETDIYYICENVVELFSKRATEKNIKFIFNIDKNLSPCILTDGMRLRQVLANLLSNAIKFTSKEGFVNFDIIVIKTTNNTIQIKFVISDTGIGIPQEKQENIFDPFIQVDHKSNREFEGTGLGLSICKSILEALGSKIEVESVIGKGTSFSFVLESKVCDKTYKTYNTFENKFNFKVTKTDSQSFKYLERYLDIFGEINDIKQKSDVYVCIYDEENIKQVRNEFKTLPKLIVFEYEKDLLEFDFEADESGLTLPFYGSKVNDTLQDLLRKTNKTKNIKIDTTKKFKGRVLVAEDNIANQELVSYILNSLNIEFNIANNGLEAFESFKKENYDLILMDINMPVMDGLQALEAIKKYEKEKELKPTKIVALTANAIKGDSEKFLSLGMDGYLSKPINTNDLIQLFNKFLDSSFEAVEEKTIENNSGINIEKIMETIGISEAVAKMIVEKFKNEIDKDLEELKTYIEAKDNKNISEKAHYIKNSCLNLALEESVKLLEEFETQSLDENQLHEKFDVLSKLLKNI